MAVTQSGDGGNLGAPRSTVGEGYVGHGAVIGFLVAMLVGAVLTLLQLWIFWPTSLKTANGSGKGGLPAEKVVDYLGISQFNLSTEACFFIIVAAAGALGGIIHATRSLAIYTGTRTLRWSWIPYYLLLPLIGALGGTLFYLVLRAGLFSPSTEVDQASPFGFAAVAALAGLFSQQALEKLRELAGQIFTQVKVTEDRFDEGVGGDSTGPDSPD
jgi:hypothetical protein